MSKRKIIKKTVVPKLDRVLLQEQMERAAQSFNELNGINVKLKEANNDLVTQYERIINAINDHENRIGVIEQHIQQEQNNECQREGNF
jgi:hypothetical protein